MLFPLKYDILFLKEIPKEKEMKKKRISIILGVILLLLLIPIPKKLKDGGTIEFQAILYKISKVHKLNSRDEYQKGIQVNIFGKTLLDTSKVTKNSDNQESTRIVKVENRLYYDTGNESNVQFRCGVMDGKITKNVSIKEIPKNNNESNFEGNYDYQFMGPDTIEVLMDGKWIVFQAKEENIIEKELDLQNLENELKAYITTEILEPMEISLQDILDVEEKEIMYSKVMKNEKNDVYVILKTKNEEVLEKVNAYFLKNYKNYQKENLGEYSIYLAKKNNDFSLSFPSSTGTIEQVEENKKLKEAVYSLKRYK